MIWVMFALGQLMHLAMQVDAIARAKNTPVTSRKQIVLDRAIPIAVRFFLCTMAFGILFGGGAGEVYIAFGSEAPQWLLNLSGLLANTSIVGYFIAGVIGFGVDSAIGFLPFVKTYIPPPIDQEQAIAEKGFRAGAAAGVEAAKEAVEEVKTPLPPPLPTDK